MSNLEKLYQNMHLLSDGWSDTPEVRATSDRLEEVLGRELYMKYEVEISDSESAHEKQGFISGFRYAVSLLTSGKEAFHDMSERRKFTGYEKDAVYERFNGRCAICGRPVGRKHMVISKKIPLSKGGTNWIENLLLTCKGCSKMKADLFWNEFLQKIGQVFLLNAGEIEKLMREEERDDWISPK